MASVNNATGVYATLGYNFDDPNGDIQTISSNTLNHLNAMPAFIDPWQAQDIANDDVGGYFQNPMSSYLNTIITTSENLIVAANTANNNGYSNALTIMVSANSLLTEAQSYLQHTNRLSGITPFAGQDLTNPYYDTAMGLGKTALYITNQTDNITNTSPILGSFTSLFVGPQIYSYANTLSADLIVLSDGATANTLTEEQITKINTDITDTNNLLTTRQTADITYYSNLRTFVDNYNSVKQFSNMGETQTYLIENFIGTPKIISRINS